jgi:hypothetical protein
MVRRIPLIGSKTQLPHCTQSRSMQKKGMKESLRSLTK